MYGEEMETRKKAADMSVKELASYIDQSVLKPEFTQDDIRKYIQEGIDYGCRTVCVNPASLDIAAELCAGTDTKICVVCDFPFGLSTTRSKCLQAEEYCRRGDIFELDVVANYGWIRSGMWDEVGADIRAVAEVCHKYGTALKGVRYLEMTDGYVRRMALDKNNEVIGYEFVNFGRMMDFIKGGMDANEALNKATGHYGRFTEADGAVKYIDPRKQ